MMEEGVATQTPSSRPEAYFVWLLVAPLLALDAF